MVSFVHLVENVEDDFKIRGVIEKVNLGSVLILQITVIEELTNPKVLMGILFLIDREDLGVGRRELSHCGILVKQSI
jgi:hypothetical protein